jgi:RimJ/RimL family protein N-acetyltransferase
VTDVTSNVRLPLGCRDGFYLSPVEEGDQVSLMEQLTDPSVSLAVPALPHPYEPSRADAWVAHRKQRHAAIGHHESLAIRDAQGKLYGCIGVDELRAPGPTRVLGYWLGPTVRGQGIASAAVAAFVPYCVTVLSARCLVARVQVWNAASMRVLLKNGFVRGARLEQHIKTRTGVHDAWVFRRELAISMAQDSAPSCAPTHPVAPSSNGTGQ